jgi:hypothetical protein
MKDTMTETLHEVSRCIDEEGLDYCFRNYSNFENVNDVKFHRLREAYLAAADALEEYVKDNAVDPLELWDDGPECTA